MQPQYTASGQVWAKMRDSLAGEKAMQKKTLSQNSQSRNCNNSINTASLDQYAALKNGDNRQATIDLTDSFGEAYRKKKAGRFYLSSSESGPNE